MNVARLAKWLSRLPKPPEVVGLGIFYVGLQGEELVTQYELPLSAELARNEVELAREILENTASDCEGREVQCRYALKAVAPGGRIWASMAIIERPESAGACDKNEPSAAGLVSSALRHNEALVRVVVGSVGTVLTAAMEMLKLQGEQLKAYQQRAQALETAVRDGNANDPEAVARAESWVKITDAIAEHAIPHLARVVLPQAGAHMPPGFEGAGPGGGNGKAT